MPLREQRAALTKQEAIRQQNGIAPGVRPRAHRQIEDVYIEPQRGEEEDDASMFQNTPKSVLRHRPIGQGTIVKERGGSRVIITPPPSTRHRLPPGTQLLREPDTEPQPTYRKKGNSLFFVCIGVGMVGAVLLFLVGSMLLAWWNTKQDDMHYGNPRTSQVDVLVGHDDSSANKSHFIALNLNRHIEIIEFPGGDATKARVFIGPVLYGDGQDLTPVTLSFVDINGDGKPDMVVILPEQNTKFYFINEKGTFRPMKPGEPGVKGV